MFCIGKDELRSKDIFAENSHFFKHIVVADPQVELITKDTKLLFDLTDTGIVTRAEQLVGVSPCRLDEYMASEPTFTHNWSHDAAVGWIPSRCSQ